MIRSSTKFGLLTSGAIVGAVFAVFASSAHAQALDDRYWLQVQAFWPDIDTKVEVSNTAGTRGTKIDLESDLKLSDRKSLPAFFAGAKIGDRWSVVGEYYALDRSSSATANRDLTFDDVTYPAGATVSSEFKTDVYRVAVGYSFIKTDKADVGAVVGLHVTQFTVGLKGQGHVGGAALSTENRKRDALAPLPTVGLYGTYQATPKITLNGRVDYLSLKVSDYDGRLVNAQASAAYRVWGNVDVGVMYRYVDYNLGIEKDRWNGDVSYTFKGPALFAQVAF
jgi:hypothetical protein